MSARGPVGNGLGRAQFKKEVTDITLLEICVKERRNNKCLMNRVCLKSLLAVNQLIFTNEIKSKFPKAAATDFDKPIEGLSGVSLKR